MGKGRRSLTGAKFRGCDGHEVEGGAGEEGGDGATNDSVAPLGGEGKGSRDAQRVTLQGRLTISNGGTRGSGE